MRAAAWSAVALSLVFLAGCGETHAQIYGSTLNLTEKDVNRKVFTVKPYTAIVVSLVSNRSMGYHWQFRPGSSPTGPLRVVSHRYVTRTQSVPGATRQEIWRFRAVGMGALPLGFVYLRRWQPQKVVRFLGATIAVS